MKDIRYAKFLYKTRLTLVLDSLLWLAELVVVTVVRNLMFFQQRHFSGSKVLWFSGRSAEECANFVHKVAIPYLGN